MENFTENLNEEEKKLYDQILLKSLDFNQSNDFAEELWRRMKENRELYEEVQYYFENNDFLCSLSVKGMTVADILVWQIDRFKAAVDEGKFGLKYNPSEMVLMAFYTLYDVTKDPELYFEHFRQETGSDYEGKTSCFTKPSS